MGNRGAKPTETLPLDGVRVLEVGGGIAAAYCTRLLRGYGAEVIRWESAECVGLLTDDEASYLLAGKVRTTETPLADLAEHVDVVVEDSEPGWLAGQGIDPVRFRQDDPTRIVISISPFGQTGPRAHWQTTNAVQFATGGLMSLTGHPDREPLVTGGSHAFYLGGLQAFAATTALLLGRLRGGVGDWIDLSMQECAASIPELYGAMSEYELDGDPVPRSGNSVRSVWGVYPAADGWAGVCCLQRQVPAFLELIGAKVANDERFLDAVQRAENDDELLAHVMGFMLDHTREELLALSPEHRVPFGSVVTPQDLLDDEGLRERGFFDRIETPSGPVEAPGRLFPGVGWSEPERVHEPGEDDDLVVRLTPRQPPSPSPSPPRRPLEGIRVADLTMMWAGPYATKLMAELGAEIVKIESPQAWDNIRTIVPQDPSIPDPWNSAYYFNEYNHSKKSLTLDLASEAGREVFLDLVPQCDLVIENYRADVLERLGVGYEVLRAARPDIVLVTMAGFGKTGPLAGHVGFGPIIEMMSGLMSLTGYGDGEP
ncbi:MAG: CoA transferase, partial [Actinomycetota bacterium]|nr:CoA transferase [Actinomycetota bacterium]